MFCYTLLLCKAINKYLLAQRKPTNNSYNLSQDMLTDKDWQQVEQLIKILKPFISVTKCIKSNTNNLRLKGSYKALQESIINIELLRQILIQTQQSLKNKNNSFIKSGINIALQKLNKYFDKIKLKSPHYFILVILYPSLKRAYFYNKQKQWLQWQKHTKQYIETVFNDYINE